MAFEQQPITGVLVEIFLRGLQFGPFRRLDRGAVELEVDRLRLQGGAVLVVRVEPCAPSRQVRRN
jgi:hypothetical protein